MGLAGRYTRICSCCKNTITYNSYKVFWKANKNNSTCRGCFYKSLVGKKLSEETKLKIGKSNKISLIGNVPPNKGKPMSKEQRKKLSNIHTGMKYGDETKKKHRMSILKRLELHRIPLNEDVGAREFLLEFNKLNNYNLKPKRFMNIGYDADGYDEINHIWLEFDPPHHFNVDGSLKERDIMRQNNILTHFNSINNPLQKFIRVKTNNNRNVFDIKTIYEGGK